MRHQIRGRRLGRSSSHRVALGRNLVSALFRHGRVVTTAPKAKEYRPMAEKLITLARGEKTVHRVRQAVSALQDKEAVRILFDEIGPAMRDRPGGYTRIVKLATPRLGDKGKRVFFELVTHVPEREESPEESKAAKGKGKKKEQAAAS
jgi:large subunit ribosomal protein L17